VPAWRFTGEPAPLSICCHVSIVRVVTRIRLDDRRIVCRFQAGAREISVSEECRPVPTKHPIDWVKTVRAWRSRYYLAPNLRTRGSLHPLLPCHHCKLIYHFRITVETILCCWPNMWIFNSTIDRTWWDVSETVHSFFRWGPANSFSYGVTLVMGPDRTHKVNRFVPVFPGTNTVRVGTKFTHS